LSGRKSRRWRRGGHGEAVEISYRQREPGNIVIDFVKKQ
jgi:hypothetical protein